MSPASRLIALAGLSLILLAGCRRQPVKAGAFSASGWLVDAPAYYASAHGDLKCTECHLETLTGDELYPHGPSDLKQEFQLDEKVCERCHLLAFRENARGVHAKAAEAEQRALEQGLEPASLTGSIYHAPRCYDCHPIHHRLTPGEE